MSRVSSFQVECRECKSRRPLQLLYIKMNFWKALVYSYFLSGPERWPEHGIRNVIINTIRAFCLVKYFRPLKK